MGLDRAVQHVRRAYQIAGPREREGVKPRGLVPPAFERSEELAGLDRIAAGKRVGAAGAIARSAGALDLVDEDLGTVPIGAALAMVELQLARAEDEESASLVVLGSAGEKLGGGGEGLAVGEERTPAELLFGLLHRLADGAAATMAALEELAGPEVAGGRRAGADAKVEHRCDGDCQNRSDRQDRVAEHGPEFREGSLGLRLSLGSLALPLRGATDRRRSAGRDDRRHAGPAGPRRLVDLQRVVVRSGHRPGRRGAPPRPGRRQGGNA